MFLNSIIFFNQVATARLNNGSEDNAVHCLKLALGWQRHVCPDYKMSQRGGFQEKAPTNLLSRILFIEIGSAVCKTKILVADYFCEKVFIGIQTMN